MKRDEMVEGIMRAAGLSKANVNRFYDGLVKLAMKKLASDGEFALPGLGTLRVRTRSAHTARNPQTGEPVQVPRKKVVRFRAYKELRDRLNPGLASGPPATEPAEAPEEPPREDPTLPV
jgi:DNA-binding protein HU-beta